MRHIFQTLKHANKKTRVSKFGHVMASDQMYNTIRQWHSKESELWYTRRVTVSVVPNGKCFFAAWDVSTFAIAFKHDKPKPNLPKRKGIHSFRCSARVC